MLESKTYLAVPPGETLKELIEDRGMSQKELAERLDCSPKHISKLLHGEVRLTERTAIRLESVLGIPASFWLNLEQNFRQTLELVKDENEMDEDKNFLKKLPYPSLCKNGWVEKKSSLPDKIREMRSFFQVSKLTSILEKDLVPKIAYRKLNNSEKSDLCALCWLQKAKVTAENRLETSAVADLDLDGLRNDLPKIKALSKETQDTFMKDLQTILSGRGVILVLLPALAGSGVQGASFILSSHVVLAMSDRNKDSDRFWFSLFHEIGHILNEDIFRKSDVSETEAEEKADNFARDSLIDPDEYLSFVTESKNFGKARILEFSRRAGIHPSILVGRLQKDKYINFNKHNNLKNKYTFS